MERDWDRSAQAVLDEAMLPAMAWRSLRVMCRRAIARDVDVAVEGADNVPATGPVLIAARHYHHLYDGCAIGLAIGRHMHILVATDWLERAGARAAMTRLCRAARFPAVLRPAAAERRPGLRADPARRAAFQNEMTRQLRRAVSESVELLRDGHVLLIFPEGYPTIDPQGSVKPSDDAWLPFEPGFVRLAALAQADRRTRVPIVPAGLTYRRGERWRLALRFGEPLWLEPGGDRDELARRVEARVRALSADLSVEPRPARAAP